MMLHDVSLSSIEPNWFDAFRFAEVLLPDTRGSFDSVVVQHRGKELLAAIVCDVRRREGTAATMLSVQQEINAEHRQPKSVLVQLIDSDIAEIRSIARACILSRGCWYGDPVPFLMLYLSNNKISDALDRAVRYGICVERVLEDAVAPDVSPKDLPTQSPSPRTEDPVMKSAFAEAKTRH